MDSTPVQNAATATIPAPARLADRPPFHDYKTLDGADLTAGFIVRVRSRQYLVEDVVPSPEPTHATLVHLSCLEDDAQGEPLEVLWEHEVDAQVVGATSWDTIASRGFDAPRLFSAYLHTLRWHCVSSTNANLFQAPYRAGIEVDRKLQRAKQVRCHFYVLPQRAEDRVLDVIVAKTARIHQELGSLSPVIERRLDSLLRDGIRHENLSEVTAAIENVDQDRVDQERSGRARMSVVAEELEESRERRDALLAQQKRLEGLLKDSRDWIGLDDRHFRDALSAALEVVGTEGLKPLDAAEAARDPTTARWEIPTLHQRMGADPTWAVTLDSLRAAPKGTDALGLATRSAHPSRRLS